MDYQMYSLDFEEFLWAKGYGSDIIDDMLSHMLAGNPFSSLEYNIYSKLFLEFCILGGMPNIVSRYIEQNHFQDSLSLQRQLLIDYESDVRKYSEGLKQTKIINVSFNRKFKKNRYNAYAIYARYSIKHIKTNRNR